MNKNEEIEIKALENGYILEYSYREKSAKDEFDYNYIAKRYMFPDWESVIKYVTDNKLTMPPAEL